MDDKVDYYLQKITAAPALRMHPLNLYEAEVMDEDVYRLDQVMLEKGLIKIEKEWRVVTGKGLEIANFGGWAAYQRQRSSEYTKRIEILDPVNKKLQKEIGVLKLEIETLNRELELRNDRDRNSSMIIQNLIRQNKNVKIMLLVGGFITGFSIAILLWIMLLQ